MNSFARRRVVIAAVVMVTGLAVAVICTRGVRPETSVSPVATSTPPPVSSTAGPPTRPAAPPPGFPNLAGLVDVSADHVVPVGFYSLTTFTSPTGLQCALTGSRGGTTAFCYGTIPGLDHPANWASVDAYQAGEFTQSQPPAAEKLGGKLLASGDKLTLTGLGNDRVTCGVQGVVVACILVPGSDQNPDRGFVLDPQRSWTF